MAHELGHVRMAWHLDSVYCHTEGASLDELDASGAFFQEPEADAFASALLVPDRFAASIVNGYETDVPDALARLALADVSAMAGLLALRKHLPPGYVFEYSGVRFPVRSTGTIIAGNSDRTSLRASAVDHGRVRHQGHMIHWYQLIEPERPLPEDEDSRTSLEVLTGIVERGWHGDPYVSRAILATIGGVLSRQKDESDPGVLLGIIRHRIANGDYSRMLADHEAELFLAKRAAEIATKRGWRP